MSFLSENSHDHLFHFLQPCSSLLSHQIILQYVNWVITFVDKVFGYIFFFFFFFFEIQNKVFLKSKVDSDQASAWFIQVI